MAVAILPSMRDFFTGRSRALPLIVGALVIVSDGAAAMQRGRTTSAKPAPAAAAKKEPAQVKCAELLGTGVPRPLQPTVSSSPVGIRRKGSSSRSRRTPAKRRSRSTCTIATSIRKKRCGPDAEYAKYTAVVGVLTMKGELLERGAVQTEFRTAADLYERISGGAGPGGVKAVAPIGREQVVIRLPQGVDQVSLLGEVLEAVTAAGRETAAPGRPWRSSATSRSNIDR